MPSSFNPSGTSLPSPPPAEPWVLTSYTDGSLAWSPDALSLRTIENYRIYFDDYWSANSYFGADGFAVNGAAGTDYWDAMAGLHATSFTGDGSGLTNLPAPSSIAGSANFPSFTANVDHFDCYGDIVISAGYSISADSFTGDGSNLTGITIQQVLSAAGITLDTDGLRAFFGLFGVTPAPDTVSSPPADLGTISGVVTQNDD